MCFLKCILCNLNNYVDIRIKENTGNFVVFLREIKGNKK